MNIFGINYTQKLCQDDSMNDVKMMIKINTNFLNEMHKSKWKQGHTQVQLKESICLLK